MMLNSREKWWLLYNIITQMLDKVIASNGIKWEADKASNKTC